MIKYRLVCDLDHEFEGWFRDSADFDVQSDEGLVECPACGSAEVRKAVMAPAIAKGSASRRERLAAVHQDMAKAVERARKYVEKNFDYVGDKFPEEARKIHYGETKERGIYGEASGKEVKELMDEGVKVAPVPASPKKTDKAGAAKIQSASSKKLN
ncbi:DUF1178 family protein [Hyphococcus flavus]|uniref:DUF1178 family protein n=1 Tax=Hyphococcus flavus TaxID=1866326 RepID=A0AAE9ZAC2_9PROT|nr:DUF1178 family protein [Hyphococcus flavus]WDI30499.1 DUF1178 family protein [Hyphococcus flavus]